MYWYLLYVCMYVCMYNTSQIFFNAFVFPFSCPQGTLHSQLRKPDLLLSDLNKFETPRQAHLAFLTFDSSKSMVLFQNQGLFVCVLSLFVYQYAFLCNLSLVKYGQAVHKVC